jgi:hypothetical protein
MPDDDVVVVVVVVVDDDDDDEVDDEVDELVDVVTEVVEVESRQSHSRQLIPRRSSCNAENWPGTVSSELMSESDDAQRSWHEYLVVSPGIMWISKSH